MPSLQLNLLGGFDVRHDAAPVVVTRKKAQALLAYLAVEPGEAHLRDKLSTLLWGDSTDQQARHSLRQTLLALRQALPHSDPELLHIDTETIAVNRRAVEIDVARLEQLVAKGTPKALEQAAALYKGDFLAGIGVLEPGFEEWLVRERERLRELALEALAKLLAHQTKSGAVAPAIQTAVRLLGLDPLQEAVHRALMRLYAKQGRRGAALRQYQVCVTVLQRELGVAPETSTKQLYQEILQTESVPLPVAALAEFSEKHLAPPSGDAQGDTHVLTAPLLGREAEMAALGRARVEAWRGQARTAVVLGEAGIGKSRLIDALAAASVEHGGRLLLGRAHETERVLPYGPWVDAFRSAGLIAELTRQPGLSAPWLVQLARLFPDLEMPGQERTVAEEDHVRLFEAMAQAVGYLAKRQPLLLVLEDLHWADDMSLRLLAFLNRRGASLPVLFVATIRLEEVVGAPTLTPLLAELRADPHFVSLTLAPLSAADTVALVRLLARVGTDETTVQRIGTQIWLASEGNPFMVVESMRALDGRDAFTASDKVRTPIRVRDIIAGRFDRMSRRARDLTALASVIGREFDFALLDRAAGADGRETAATVEELVARHVLHVVDERLDFTHDRIREVAYERLLAPQRRLLHAAVATAMETLYASDLASHYVALSRHCQQGALWEKTVVYFKSAGAAAATRAAHREAVACFEQALGALHQLPQTPVWLEHSIDVRFALRHSLAALGEHTQILDHLEAAETTAHALGDKRRLGWVCTYRTNSLYFVGENESALASGERARSLAEDLGDARLRVVADFFLGQACQAVGQLTRVASLMRPNVHPLDDERSRRDGSPTQQVYARSALACCLAELGEFPEALACSAEAVQMAEAADQTYPLVHACFSRGMVYARNGDLARAVPVVERGLHICRGREFPVLAAVNQGLLGYVYALSGRLAEGLALLETAVDALARSMRGSALAMANLGEGYLLAGRRADARDVCDRALSHALDRKERGIQGWALRLQGEIVAQSVPVDLEAAAACYRNALAIAADLGMLPLRALCHLGLGRCYRRAGRHDEARAELTAATHFFSSMQSHWLADAAAELRACRC